MAWRLIAARGAIASAGGPWPKSIEGTLGIFCVADARRRATNALFGLDADLLDAVTTADLNQRAARPLRAGLKIDRVRAALGKAPRDAEDGLRAMREVINSA